MVQWIENLGGNYQDAGTQESTIRQLSTKDHRSVYKSFGLCESGSDSGLVTFPFL